MTSRIGRNGVRMKVGLSAMARAAGEGVADVLRDVGTVWFADRGRLGEVAGPEALVCFR